MKIQLLVTVLFLSAYPWCSVSGESTPPDDVIEHYIKKNSFPGKGEKEIVKRENIFIKYIDVNGDGQSDWYLDDPNRCGSQGCNGSIYLFHNNKYCFSGYESRHLVGKVLNKELECRE